MEKLSNRNMSILISYAQGQSATDIRNTHGISLKRTYTIIKLTAQQILNIDRAQYMCTKAIAEECRLKLSLDLNPEFTKQRRERYAHRYEREKNNIEN